MKKLALGLMRLPTKTEEYADIDYIAINEMVDLYIDCGFNYFDSGYTYHDGNADKVVKNCIIDRYPREDVLIANKMPLYHLKGDEDIEALFQEQLDKCGLEYFDYYLVHNTNDCFQEVCDSLDCFNFIFNKKEQGLINKVGFSHHDTAEKLEEILNDYPQVDFVLLQLNYLDWDDVSIQSRKCYEVARAHNIEIMVMEPVKGGILAKVPNDVEKLFKDYNPNASVASWAIRFVASLEGVTNILSGSSDINQLKDNIKTILEFKPLNEEELAIIDDAKEIIAKSIEIPCTECNYCLDHCNNNINIPKFFSLYNGAKLSSNVPETYYIYYNNYAIRGSKASQCDHCNECINGCPQHINIPEELGKVVDLLENNMFTSN